MMPRFRSVLRLFEERFSETLPPKATIVPNGESSIDRSDGAAAAVHPFRDFLYPHVSFGKQKHYSPDLLPGLGHILALPCIPLSLALERLIPL
jgi:hypothetical protein